MIDMIQDNTKGKIIATLGPQSDTPELIDQLIKAGLDLTELGNIAVRHEGDISDLWTKTGEAATQKQIQELWDRPLGGGGGGSWLDSLFAGLGGAGIGALVALAAIYFLMIRKG